MNRLNHATNLCSLMNEEHLLIISNGLKELTRAHACYTVGDFSSRKNDSFVSGVMLS